jgi:hypothetical protein
MDDGWVGGWTNEWMGEWVGEIGCVGFAGQMDGRMHIMIIGWMDGYMGGIGKVGLVGRAGGRTDVGCRVLDSFLVRSSTLTATILYNLLAVFEYVCML